MINSAIRVITIVTCGVNAFVELVDVCVCHPSSHFIASINEGNVPLVKFEAVCLRSFYVISLRATLVVVILQSARALALFVLPLGAV